VSSADLSGGPTSQLRITVDPAKLSATGIPLAQIAGVIGGNQVSIPSGTIAEGGERLPVSVEHRFSTTDDLGALIVGASGTTPVRLADIASIAIDEVQASGYARTNGVPSLTLTVSKASGANTVVVADEVTAAMEAIEADHPGVLAVEVIQDLSVFIKESRDGLVREGLLELVQAEKKKYEKERK